MSYFPDMGRETMVMSGEFVRAVGWLHKRHAYTTGEVSGEFRAKLKQCTRRSGESAYALRLPAAGGWHTSEFCNKENGSQNFGVAGDGVVFISPEMIYHYVTVHGYCPPAEFVAAVLALPLPGMKEYGDGRAVREASL